MRAGAWIGCLTLVAASRSQVTLPDAHAAALRALAPRGVIERRVVALAAPAHTRLCEDLHDDELPRTWFVYVARVDGIVAAIAMFDTHRVRTLRETLLLAFDPELRLRSVDVVAFAEPRRYQPKAKYYARYEGRTRADLDGRGIDAVSGATLTTQATGRAVRRALAFGAELRADGSLEEWGRAIPAKVQAAAGAAHGWALSRLRARFPGAEVRPRTRLAGALDGGAWIAEFEVRDEGGPRRAAFVHTTIVADEVVSALVVVAPEGSLATEPLGKGDGGIATAAVRAMLARERDAAPR